MKLRYRVLLRGRPITNWIDDKSIDVVFEQLKRQITAQGGNSSMLDKLTDIELEEGEYEEISI